MKRFKFWIVGLFTLLFVSSFCSAGTFTIEGNVNSGFDSIMNIPQRTYGTDFTVHCVFDASYLNCQGGDALTFVFKYGKVYSSNMNSTTTINTNSSYSMNCDNPSNIVVDFDFSTVLPGGGPYGEFYGVTYIKFDNRYTVGNQNIPYSCTFVGNNILNSGGGSCPECPDCPVCDNTSHMGIYQGGSLVQGLDSNTGFYNIYLSDGLDFSITPTSEGQSIYITGYDFSGVSWSELVINDIVHQSAPLIDITIPEEFDWDYTGNENEFTLDIKGFNVDTEYIDGIIRTQKTTPNNTDFNNIVSGLIPLLVPGLVIILFIYFIFRFIKKVF